MKSFFLACLLTLMCVGLYGQRYELRAIDKIDHVQVQIRNVNEKALRSAENRVTDIVFGLKWRNGNVIALEIMPGGGYNMKLSDGVKSNNGYSYQAFGSMGTPYTMPVDWNKDKWVDLVVLKVHANGTVKPGTQRFTLCEVGFDVTTEPNVGIDLVDETPKLVPYQVSDNVVPNHQTASSAHLVVTKYGPYHGHLSWDVDDPDGVIGYQVERKIGEGEWKDLSYIPSDGQFVHGYVDEGVYNGIDRKIEIVYRVRVISVNGQILSEEKLLDFSQQKTIARVFPNPASDKVNVALTATETDGPAYLEIYGRDGRLVYRQEILSGSVREEIDLARSNIESGSYTVHLMSGDNLLDAHPLHIMR